MNRLTLILSMIVLLLLANYAVAYEIGTHGELSLKAFDNSVLKKDSDILKNLGLTLEDEFPNSNNDIRTIPRLIRDGARFEDNAPRFLNHFYDPINNRGLRWGPVSGEKSPVWALEDEIDYPLQNYSYRHANEYLYLALTTPHEKQDLGNPSFGRNEYFGRLFQTLGQVIHHLQDMAQPQHVRNDAHPSF